MKLKQLRVNKNLTQSALSRLSGVSQSYIHDLENNKKYPTVKTLKKLANALGVSISSLVDEKESA